MLDTPPSLPLLYARIRTALGGKPAVNEASQNPVRGRGAAVQPASRFARILVEDDFEHLEYDEDMQPGRRTVPTEYFVDHTRSIVSENDSPDIPFRYSLNPYRGCSHGCSYCYARPTHEYLDLSAGLDFETKIFVKERAPDLFREWLARDGWRPEPVMLSGVTDCYQPAERRFELTRRCLEVALAARQPVCIVTKNALVTRDLDLLRDMAGRRLVRVALSVTSLDQTLTRVMEPRTSSPAARLRTIAELTQAGVPAMVMVAPVIPGLTDSEMPAILREAAAAGAVSAGYVLLRLPLSVRPVFLEWLARTHPTRKRRIESLIRATRDGRLNDANFGSRMTGHGPIADQIRQTFAVFSRRYGLDRRLDPLDVTQFEPPRPASEQMRLF
ncbi:MAG TPA: PA0069 family radical SAM protein [Planctomycetaceae bacterium]|nr:PA0069 family radical SAM protein [Planctomycetaceae bacterium]